MPDHPKYEHSITLKVSKMYLKLMRSTYVVLEIIALIICFRNNFICNTEIIIFVSKFKIIFQNSVICHKHLTKMPSSALGTYTIASSTLIKCFYQNVTMSLVRL